MIAGSLSAAARVFTVLLRFFAGRFLDAAPSLASAISFRLPSTSALIPGFIRRALPPVSLMRYFTACRGT